MLSPIHLQTLAKVVETGSIAAAARALSYSASAVSQQIAALERETGVLLFERGGHEIRPTDGALFIVARGAKILSSLRALERDIGSSQAGFRGRLRIGTFPTAGIHIVPAALDAVLSARPDVMVSLDEGEPNELVPILIAGDIDVALVYEYDMVPREWPSELTCTRLADDDLALLLPPAHEFALEPDVPLLGLSGATWVAYRPGTAGATCLLRLCAAAGFTPNVSFRSNHNNVIEGLVHSGLGVALIPTLGRPMSGRVRVTRLRDARPQRHVSALYRPENPNPLVPQLITALQVVARESAT